jgi:hypothetical protein
MKEADGIISSSFLKVKSIVDTPENNVSDVVKQIALVEFFCDTLIMLRFC